MISTTNTKLTQRLLLGIAALALPATASAQQVACVSREESRAIVAHLLPTVITSTAQRCGPVLGRSAYLPTNAARLAARLTPLSSQSWPAAKAALERSSGTRLPENDTILQFGRLAIAEGITQKLDAKSCSGLNQLAEQLAPLPPSNFANVFALFLEFGAQDDRQSPIRVCSA